MKGLKGRLRMDLANAAAETGAKRGVEKALQVLLRHSLEEVPRDTGRLANSGHVDTDGITGTVSYQTPYAVAVHERRDIRHPHGGKAKYLEDPARDAGVQREMLTALGEEIGRELT